MLIQIDVLQNKQVVRRFTRKYKCRSEQAHAYAQKWGRRLAKEDGVEYDQINTKTIIK